MMSSARRARTQARHLNERFFYAALFAPAALNHSCSKEVFLKRGTLSIALPATTLVFGKLDQLHRSGFRKPVGE